MSGRHGATARGEDGFTLVELLVVIVILGILSAVVVFAVRGLGDKGKTVAVATDERILRTAEEAYCAQNGKYADMGTAAREPGTLVGDGYLSEPSEYHDVTTAAPEATEGTCPGQPQHYTIKCRDGSPPPNCGAAGTNPSSTTSTTAPPVDTWVSLSSGPTPRVGAPMAPVPSTKSLVMFGGEGPGPAGTGGAAVAAFLGDTWVWAGSWALAAPPTEAGCPNETAASLAPCPRRGHAMTYDAARDNVVLIGGEYKSGPTYALADTWTWNGTAWTYRGWGPQIGSGAMAYDDARRTVVLFGGDPSDGKPFSDDTWIWNGTSWAKAAPVHHPPARKGAAMAFDPVGRRLILFGGSDESHNIFSDTWAWDGSDWTRLSPSPSPSSREHPAMATNPTAGEIVLFGGDGAEGTLADTWVWDGTKWTKRAPTVSPPGRGQASFAYHDTSHEFVLFGGDATVPSSADTWGYTRTSTPTTTVP